MASKRVVPCTLRLLEGRRSCTQTQKEERVIRFEISDECSSVLIQPSSLSMESNAAQLPSVQVCQQTPLTGTGVQQSTIHRSHPTPVMMQQQIRNENGIAPSHKIQRKIRNTSIGICAYPKFRVMGAIRLFELEVGESDFVELRRDQALLVDFHNFAHSFVSLLGFCDLGESGNNHDSHESDFDTSTSLSHGGSNDRFVKSPFSPNSSEIAISRYTCRIEEFNCCNTSSSASRYSGSNQNYANNNIGARFSVVESNQFRELTHLSLNLQVGTDASLRSYLSTRLGQNMCENLSLKVALDDEIRRADASEELCQQMEAKLQKLTHTSNIAIRQVRLESTEQMQKASHEENEKFTMMLQEKEYVFQSLKEQMECQLKELEEKYRNEEMCSLALRTEKSSLEANMEQLRNKLDERESALKELNIKLDDSKSKIQQLEQGKESAERISNQALIQIAALEQSVEGKENILLQVDAYREAANKASAEASDNLQKYQIQLEEARTKLTSMTDEMTKVTDFNTQLQNDRRDFKSKLKLRAKVIRRQEEVLNEKEAQLTNLERKLSNLTIDFERCKVADSAKDRDLEMTKKKLAESVTILEKNKHVRVSTVSPVWCCLKKKLFP